MAKRRTHKARHYKHHHFNIAAIAVILLIGMVVYVSSGITGGAVVEDYTTLQNKVSDIKFDTSSNQGVAKFDEDGNGLIDAIIIYRDNDNSGDLSAGDEIFANTVPEGPLQ